MPLYCTTKAFRPFWRRLFNTFFPPGLCIFFRNPCFFTLFLFFGCQVLLGITRLILEQKARSVNPSLTNPSKCIIISRMIKFDDFAKVDIRAGKVVSCEKVEKSNKLLRMIVDFGELGEKQILTGLGEFIQPAEIAGITALFVVNLEPRKLMGFDSEGMIMGTDDEMPKIVQAPQGTMPGTRII